MAASNLVRSSNSALIHLSASKRRRGKDSIISAVEASNEKAYLSTSTAAGTSEVGPTAVYAGQSSINARETARRRAMEQEARQLLQEGREAYGAGKYSIALEKFHAMEHRYPAKADIIDKFGYDGKQVSHLIRVDDYLERYINGESYLSCLHPTESKRERIMEYKLLDRIDLETARVEAKEYLDHAVAIADAFCEGKKDEEDTAMRELLEDVSYNIMRIAVEKELSK